MKNLKQAIFLMFVMLIPITVNGQPIDRVDEIRQQFELRSGVNLTLVEQDPGRSWSWSGDAKDGVTPLVKASYQLEDRYSWLRPVEPWGRMENLKAGFGANYIFRDNDSLYLVQLVYYADLRRAAFIVVKGGD